jgi:hypothetical protein
MSNLSFARIMYGTNENPDSLSSMYAGTLPSHLPKPISGLHAPLENWVRKILHSVLPTRF